MVEEMRRGVLCAPDDAASIAAAIENLLNGRCSDGRLDLSPDAVAAFRQDVVVGRLTTLFDKVLNRSEGRPVREYC